MPRLMSTEEYARSYDRCAERLYRFALYVLGDARQAESAVSSAFARGLQTSPPLKGDDTFLEEMLRLICGACECSVPLEGDSYADGIRRAVAGDCEESLLRVLASKPCHRRAVLILNALFGCDTTALQRILSAKSGRPVSAAAIPV